MASRSVTSGDTALREIQATGIKGSLSNIQLDVTECQSISSATKTIEEKFGRLDVLVNNAGIFNIDPDVSFKTELETALNTNTVGAALVTEAFEPLLRLSKKPYVLYLGSTLGCLTISADSVLWNHRMGAIGYRVSKAALNMLMLEESKRLGDIGFKVLCVCPGLVRSNLRGTAEEQKNAGGKAGDPEDSGKFILSVIEGHRDADHGRYVHKDGIHPW